MKKVLLIFSVLVIGFMAGCSQQPAATNVPAIEAATVAASVGSMASQATSIDNAAMSFVDISGLQAQNLSAKAPTVNSSGYWSTTEVVSYGGMSISYNMNVRITDISGTIINTPVLLAGLDSDNINKLEIYSTLTITVTGTNAATSTMTMGTSSDPLIFTGIGLNATLAKSIDGPVSFSGSDSEGHSYSISINYDALALAAAGYPSGTVTFSVSALGSAIYAGSIVYNGTYTATLTFTSGATGSYSINLDSGVVVPASID